MAANAAAPSDGQPINDRLITRTSPELAHTKRKEGPRRSYDSVAATCATPIKSAAPPVTRSNRDP